LRIEFDVRCKHPDWIGLGRQKWTHVQLGPTCAVVKQIAAVMNVISVQTTRSNNSDVCVCVFQGITSVVSYLQTKQRHPRVIWVNLRDDVTIQCDLVTYSVRDTAALDEPILLPAAARTDIEVNTNNINAI